MKAFKVGMTIGKKLTVGVILLLITVSSGLGVMSYLQASRSVEKQIVENAPVYAENGAKLIRSILDCHLAVLKELAENPNIKSMNWDDQLPELRSAVKRLGFSQLGIAAADGKGKLDDGITLADISKRDYYIQGMKGDVSVSEIIIHKTLGIPIQVLAVPVKSGDGSVNAVLFAIMDATWLSSITDSIGYGEKGYSYIIDGQGVLIAHREREWVRAQRNFIKESETDPSLLDLAAMIRKMIGHEKDYGEYTLDGTKRIFGFAPIEGTSWSIGVGAY